ncbi:MAG: rhomboid family intramembrane serine protease [Armatimonadota bacterium]
MRSRRIEDFAYWLVQDRIPLVKGLILANALSFFVIALAHPSVIVEYLAYASNALAGRPWIAVTYPLVGLYGDSSGIISLLFAGYWLWVAGGSLERSWGTARFATYFVVMCALSAVGLYVGTLITGVPTAAAGLWLPLAGVTVAFAMNNPEQQILFFFVVPLKLKYLALLDVAILLIAYGQASLIVGITALVGCAYSYWYVRGPRAYSWRRSSAGRSQVIRVPRRGSVLRLLNPLYWYREYRERKRLRDLFEK